VVLSLQDSLTTSFVLSTGTGKEISEAKVCECYSLLLQN